MTITDAVITRIRELSYEHDITITRWCMRAGVLPSTVYGILKKKSGCPRVPTLKLLGEGIGITLSEFFAADYFDHAECEDWR